MTLSIKTHRRGAREIVITLYGEVDYATAQDLRATISSELAADDLDAIVVDMAGVTFVDSTGVGTLVVARRICGDLAISFRVRNPNPFVAKLFTVVGVAELLGLPVTTLVPPRVPRPRAAAARSHVA